MIIIFFTKVNLKFDIFTKNYYFYLGGDKMPVDSVTCYTDALYYDKYYYDEYEKTESLAEVEAEQQQQQQIEQTNQESQNEVIETYKGSYVNVTI